MFGLHALGSGLGVLLLKMRSRVRFQTRKAFEKHKMGVTTTPVKVTILVIIAVEGGGIVMVMDII